MRKIIRRRRSTIAARKPTRTLSPQHGVAETLRGEIVEDVKLYGDSGWGFTWLIDLDSQEEVKISGTLEGYAQGHLVNIEGKWNLHHRWGYEVQISRIWEDTPETEEGIMKWLTDHLPQIGPIRARQIVDTFKTELWNVIETSPQKLRTIDGLTLARIQEIKTAYKTYKAERETVVELYSMGLNQREVRAAKKALGDNVLTELKANPYVLFENEAIGLSWSRVERLAEGRVAWNSPNRVRAAMLHTLQYFASEGHTAVEIVALESEFRAVVGVATDALEPLNELKAMGRVVMYKDHYMLTRYALFEQEISDTIIDLLRPETTQEKSSDDRPELRA